jgi:hypothetical protein
MQDDGNLVLYDAMDTPTWDSKTWKIGNLFLWPNLQVQIVGGFRRMQVSLVENIL